MDELEHLFNEYRAALPDPDASANFTPGVWKRIESRRFPVRLMKRAAEAFVALAAVVTLLIGMFIIPRMQTAPVYSASYVDVLSAERSADGLDYTDIARTENPTPEVANK